MHTIKFRGRDMNGHFVYGLLTKKKIRSSGEVVFAIAKSEKQSETIPVNEDSIAQLVGYDSDGREVYEGDYVYVRTNRGNITFKPATMIDIHLVHTYKLKEASDNA